VRTANAASLLHHSLVLVHGIWCAYLLHPGNASTTRAACFRMGQLSCRCNVPGAPGSADTTEPTVLLVAGLYRDPAANNHGLLLLDAYLLTTRPAGESQFPMGRWEYKRRPNDIRGEYCMRGDSEQLASCRRLHGEQT
jgi:hypothetical protein